MTTSNRGFLPLIVAMIVCAASGASSASTEPATTSAPATRPATSTAPATVEARVRTYTYKDGLKSGDKDFLKELAQRWFFNKEPVGLPVLEEGNQALLDAQNKVIGFTTKVKEDDIRNLQGKYGNENVTLKAGERIYIDVQRKQILDATGKLLLSEKTTERD